MSTEITIPGHFQGATGRGHGGYTAGLLAERLPGRATADFFVPIPLERRLKLHESEGETALMDGSSTVLRLRSTTEEIRIPPFVSLAEATAAQARSPVLTHDVLPDCFSCGTRPDSMRVHAGPVEGRDMYATTWTPAANTADRGVVRDRYVWGAIDCPSGWVIGTSGEAFRMSVTGEMWAEVFELVRPDVTYVLVAWGDPWRGRRATAGTALFDAEGVCLAAAQSMWIATP